MCFAVLLDLGTILALHGVTPTYCIYKITTCLWREPRITRKQCCNYEKINEMSPSAPRVTVKLIN